MRRKNKNLGQFGPSGRSQPKALSDRSACARTCYFTFDLQSSEAGVASLLKAFKSSQFRESNLKAPSIISFSFTNRDLIEPNGPLWQVQEKTFKKSKRQWALKYFRNAVTDVVTAL
jgi:hypothetical protein